MTYWPNSMTFQAWKIPFLNSMTFEDAGKPCNSYNHSYIAIGPAWRQRHMACVWTTRVYLDLHSWGPVTNGDWEPLRNRSGPSRVTISWAFLVPLKLVCLLRFTYRVAQKTGPPAILSHCKISKTPWPNCVEIGERLQYYMLNTVINFLFKNFIALWRHLAKSQLCDAQIYL